MKRKIIHQPQTSTNGFSIELPHAPLSLNSPFYVERPPLETLAYAEITQPGSLLRLKASRHMGKSSLLLRISDRAQTLAYRPCTVDFLQADMTSFAQLDTFLRWFCASIACQLGFSPKLDDYWDPDIGSKVSCTIYLEHRLLSQVSEPIVLLLNEVNRVFEQETIAADFLSLLRFWYEQGRRSPLWQKLRLVMAYSTEIYIPLKLEQSPFNVGRQLRLPEFSLEQVQDLAARYGVGCHKPPYCERFVSQLFNLVGGHPYLVHLAIVRFQAAQCAHEDLLAEAINPTGIYADHLRSFLLMVRQRPELVMALQSLTQHPEGIHLSSHLSYLLDSLGIVRLEGTLWRFTCELYRRFFQAELETASLNWVMRLDQLELENQRLQTLAYTDGLTQLPNRRAFDLHLDRTWQRMGELQAPLTLMLCDVDHFKQYNDNHGHPVGDQCLRQVAHILSQNIRTPTDFVARYGGEEFAVILTQIDREVACSRAEQLRSQVSQLTARSAIPGVTLSVGVASVIPCSQWKACQLIAAADQALYASKGAGRDRMTFQTLA